MTAGFGQVGGAIIDTHFLERGRVSRLMEMGATNPEYLAIGIGEDSAVLFEGDMIRCFGFCIQPDRAAGSNQPLPVAPLHRGRSTRSGTPRTETPTRNP